jgi:hypothetical protein
MAKKNLINADMLLATPKRQEEYRQFVEIPVPVVEQVQQTAIPMQKVPMTPSQPEVSSIKKGLKSDETRATFIVREDLLEKLKAVAYWERLNIKKVINEALDRYVGAYERQNGELKEVPKK